jgi:glycosyltransferase involved in cell wall biosynthesis
MIPTYNGIQYLPSCISTVISQEYSNYELIISDDHSNDGTKEYLDSLNFPNVTILYTPYKMSMSEHWEWVLSHASGDWCIFLGQDDGLQPNFFTLADKLTDIALKRKIRIIASERAYYFWPGCESVYNNAHISYFSIEKISVFSTRFKMIQALCGYIPYFNLPQMYTTSIFNKSIVEETRKRQGGLFFITHPQDANTAAISCKKKKKYIYSYIPLGWVGTSPKSAGLALNTEINKQLSVEYINKIKNSGIKYCEKIGDFKIGSCVLYLWGALIMTKTLQSKLFQLFINSRIMTYIVFAAGRNEIKKDWDMLKKKYIHIEQINNIKYFLLSIFMYTLKIFNSFSRFIERCYRIILRQLFNVKIIRYSQEQNKTMKDINIEVNNLWTVYGNNNKELNK